VSWRDRFSELKDSVEEWREGSADRGFDSQVEKHLTTLKSGSEQARAAAVKALLVQVQAAERWREPIVKALLGTLPEQPAQPQLAIIEALQVLRELMPERQDDFFEAIQATLDSPHREVRLHVVKLWTGLSINSDRRRDETIPDLFELLDDDDKDVRYATQDALGRVLHKAPAQALPKLRDALKHRDWRVRYHAIVLLTALAGKQPQAAIKLAPAAVAALKSRDRVQERAAECVGVLGRHSPQAVAPAVPSLIRGLKSNSSELRKACATALGRIGNRDALVVMQAVPHLARALENDDWYIHVEVLKALGYIGANKPALVKPHLAIIRSRTTRAADRNITQTAKWALRKAGGS
jgi:hypothetical protein|tara:strand:+ start:3250 stop:4305 length:1056 start_codon:yes stop_codon:yes gene_type:complete